LENKNKRDCGFNSFTNKINSYHLSIKKKEYMVIHLERFILDALTTWLSDTMYYCLYYCLFLLYKRSHILITGIVLELTWIIYSTTFHFSSFSNLLIFSHLSAVMHCRSLPRVQVVGIYRNYVSGIFYCFSIEVGYY